MTPAAMMFPAQANLAPRERWITFYSFAASFVCLDLLVIHPLAAWAASATALLLLPRSTPASARRILAATMVAATSFLVAMRPLGVESDDMANYYIVYQRLAADDFDFLFGFGGGFEVGLPIFILILAKLLPTLTPSGLMLCFALSSSALFLFWIEKTFYALDDKWRSPMLLAAALLLLNLWYSTQLVRQFFSALILLFAFTTPTWNRKLLLVVCAATFHLTALVFYFAYELWRRGPWGIFCIVAVAIFVRVNFVDLLGALENLPPALVDKLIYYVDNSEGYTDADLGALKLITQLCLISALGFIVRLGKLPSSERQWHAIPWIAAVVHLALLPLPLVSLRATLAIHSIAAGVIAFQMLQRQRTVFIVIVLGAVLLYKFVGHVQNDDLPKVIATWQIIWTAFEH